MKRMIAPCCCLLAVAALALGCSKVGTSTGTGTQGNSWTHHGVLRIAGVSEPDNVNPLLGNQQIEVDLSMFWAGYLFNWSDQNEFVPELATEVPTTKNGGISTDGLAITYHLRSGVKWQDGAPFSADDVVFSWHAVMNPKNNIQTRLGYDLISGIDKKDDYTIVVHLKKRWAPFVASFFTMSSTPYPIQPKHLLGQYADLNHIAYNNKPVGTGPFIFQEYQRGTVIRMTANPNYWRGAPKLKEVDYKIIPDETTILTQLRTHEADMEYNAPASQTPSFKQIKGVHIYLTPFTQYRQIAFNLTNPILSDVRVRQALAYAVDQQELIDTVSHGVDMKGDTDQPPFLWAHADHVKQYPHDVAQAGRLLDEAGWKLGQDGYRYKNGQRLALEMSGTTGSAETRNLEAVVQREWRLVGVEGDIKNYQSGLFFATIQSGGFIQSGNFETAFYSWINGVDPDDSTLFMCNQFPPNGQNSYRFCNHELDAAEQVAMTEYDQDKRKVAYDKIQSILAEQEPLAIVWFVRRQDIVNSDLLNYKPAHAVTTFWNTWEWEL
ncbi:MAG: peptide ABC transporter substrate-binding protein [Candidatus Eremiobacteraeota bacterium]|nr:peptide ABC transporter substrate-binding protein [Candidatus Eremiobacteraeota bacterium]